MNDIDWETYKNIFRVEQVYEYDMRRYKPDLTKPTGRWMVHLPHQCDEWEVGLGSHEVVITMLEHFLADGQRALEQLRAGIEDERED